jgi:hypothetical protein
MSHIIQNRSQFDGIHRSNCEFSSKQIRAHYPFFLKPYIHFGDICHEPVNDATLTSPEASISFSTNVWVIKIENKKYGKLTRNAFNTNVEITPFGRGVDTGKRIHMVWKSDSLPNTCRFPSSSLSRDEYRTKIPFCYVKELIQEDISTTILSGGERDMIIGCTFNDFNSLYIVSHKSSFGEADITHIPFNELNATSWNDVKLTWV